MKKKRKGQIVDVLAKQEYREFSYAMIGCQAFERQVTTKDFTLFLVYDHR